MSIVGIPRAFLIDAAVFVGMLALGGCTNARATQEAADAYGFNNVQVTGYRAFGCGEDDPAHTGFTATNSRGDQVEGIVCSGTGPLGKGATLRVTRTVRRADVSTVELAQ